MLAQLGSRVQHQLRAHTPNDAKALKATVNTYPNSAYDDLGQVITSLGIGEAIVTVMNERGAPTPVAWTRLRAPESLMAPTDAAAMQATVAASPRYAKYATAIDRESAREMLAAKLEAGAQQAAADEAAAKEREAKAAKSASRSRPRPRVAASKAGRGRRHPGVVKSGAFKAVHADRRPRDRARDVRHRPPAVSEGWSRTSGRVAASNSDQNVRDSPRREPTLTHRHPARTGVALGWRDGPGPGAVLRPRPDRRPTQSFASRSRG